MVLLLFLAEEPLLPLPRRHEDHVPRLEPEKAGLFLEKIATMHSDFKKNTLKSEFKNSYELSFINLSKLLLTA